jgi:hypothetical protein
LSQVGKAPEDKLGRYSKPIIFGMEDEFNIFHLLTTQPSSAQLHTPVLAVISVPEQVRGRFLGLFNHQAQRAWSNSPVMNSKV